MSNIRLTIIMFMLAIAVGSVMLVGWHQAGDAHREQRTAGLPVIDPATFAPAGLKRAPWDGQGVDPAKKPAAAAPAGPASPSDSSPASSPSPIAVIELFTSEGCSSCPPAERLVNELAQKYAADPSVVLLAFHVDYWDKLGWKDRLASADFTARQHAYASAFAEASVYTPQMVVNGARGFVGSDRDKAADAIAEARKSAPAATLAIDAADLMPGATARLSATLTSAASSRIPDSAAILFAIVEDGLTTQVKRGENDGRTLTHDRVVRAAAPGKRGDDGRLHAEVSIPADLKPDRARIVVLVQDAKTLHTLAAAQTRATAK